MANVIQMADQLARALNTHSFSQAFTAARMYRPYFDLKDLAGLHVSVVPRGMEAARVTRGAVETDVQVDIGIQKKISADSEMDVLMGVTKEVFEFLMSGDAELPIVSVSNVPIYSPEHLGEWRQFTSVLTVTMRDIQ